MNQGTVKLMNGNRTAERFMNQYMFLGWANGDARRGELCTSSRNQGTYGSIGTAPQGTRETNDNVKRDYGIRTYAHALHTFT